MLAQKGCNGVVDTCIWDNFQGVRIKKGCTVLRENDIHYHTFCCSALQPSVVI